MLFQWDPDARISHFKLREAAVALQSDAIHADYDLPRMGKLRGVPHQVDQDLPKPRGISNPLRRKRWIDIANKFNFLLCDRQGYQVEASLHQLRDVERRALQIHV